MTMTELTPIRRGRCAGAGNWQTQYQALQMTAREAAELIRDVTVKIIVSTEVSLERRSCWRPAAISPSTGTSSPPGPGC